MKIIVDGDAQPAKDRIIEAGKKLGVKVVIIYSVAHYTEKIKSSYPEIVLVDNRKQETDIKMMNMAGKGDIAVTNDTGLGLVLAGKGEVVVTAKGRRVSDTDLSAKMEAVHIEKKAIRAKGKGKKKKAKLKGPAAYTKKDADRLVNTLEEIIREEKK